jgi:uncharacterized OB-fold protein
MSQTQSGRLDVSAPLLPDPANPLLAPHWQAAAEHRLAVSFCAACNAPQWPPRPNCTRCRSFDVTWRQIPDTGELFTYFIARKALHPSLADQVPYATGVVRLESGLKMLGRLVNVDVSDIRIGMPLRAAYVQRASEVTLVHWEPLAAGEGVSTGENPRC